MADEVSTDFGCSRRLALGIGLALSLLGPDAALGAPAADGDASEDARLRALLDRMYEAQVDASPEMATSVKLDNGVRAGLRHKLDDRSTAAYERQLCRSGALRAELAAIDPEKLGAMERVSREVMLWSIGTTVDRGHKFDYGRRTAPVPFLLTRKQGAYIDVPEFLRDEHDVAGTADAEAYLDRLQDFARVLDQETQRFREDVSVGVIPSQPLLAPALDAMRLGKAKPPLESELVRSLADKARAAGVAGDWEARAGRIVERQVYPAFDRQITAVADALPGAPAETGAWRFPDGAGYYDYSVGYFATTNIGEAELHRMGLEQVREITAELDGLLKAQGLTKGTVGERLNAMSHLPRFLLPDTEAGKQQAIAIFNRDIADISRRLPRVFNPLPHVPVEVKRVPADREAGSAQAYYDFPPADGSKPGIFWVNLRNMSEWPTWRIPTTVYHETLPGHHLQVLVGITLKDMPKVRKNLFLGAHGEGWALYAEQLADELGCYDRNPAGRIGRLQFLLLRAARLVLDTGLHVRKWTRQQAIRYYMETIGERESVATNEIDRYLLMPGQATSYKVGHEAILAARVRAKAALGARFDIRGFHDAVIGSGALPLAVMDRLVDAWIARAGGKA